MGTGQPTPMNQDVIDAVQLAYLSVQQKFHSPGAKLREAIRNCKVDAVQVIMRGGTRKILYDFDSLAEDDTDVWCMSIIDDEHKEAAIEFDSVVEWIKIDTDLGCNNVQWDSI